MELVREKMGHKSREWSLQTNILFSVDKKREKEDDNRYI